VIRCWLHLLVAPLNVNKYSGKTQNSTAICHILSLAALKAWRKTIPWRNLQSTILIGQVNILSWGQLGCTRVPRPFLLLRRVWFRD